MSGTKISDLSDLKGLNGLTSLYLSGTKISDLSGLKGLNGLTSLDLSGTKISDLSDLKGLNGLTSLDLSGTKISDLSDLKGLNGLTSLDLSGTKISDLSDLKGLNGLISLDLSGNTKISDLSDLKGLNGLTSLYLSGTKISDLSDLKGLNGLTSLDLSGTKISDLSDLKGLNGLTSLYLSGTKISDLSDLKGLNGLTSLYLSGTKISDLSGLKGLNGLTSLYLSGTNISDLSDLKGLNGLTSLYLSGTNISDLSDLKGLNGLTSLDLSGTNISDLSDLKGLNGLTSLNLGYTNIRDSSDLKGLNDLTSLYLSGTKITDVSFIVDLPCIKKIDLDGIETLIEPPQQIIDEGLDAIRNYFRQKDEQGTDPLYEAKVLIVGEPDSGKTSLRKKLVDPDYKIPNEETSTLGVEVQKEWNFPFPEDKNVIFNASIWDFGGQDIQYMIHQYFLTGKSLYIMVADERKQNTHYEYWFNIIQLLGEGSPVLVVLNKRDGVAITSYDHSEICKAFPKLQIEKFELDMARDQQAFIALREKIQTLLRCLPHVGDKLPAKWPLIRDSLEEMKEKNHISLKDYFKVCEQHNIKNEDDALLLADYLHALGTIIHFRDDEVLRDLVILDPNWVVDALYTALSDKKIQSDNGYFTRDWLFNLWCNPSKEGKTAYTTDECRQLLSLMSKEKFELCYELEERGSFISPQLLVQTPPDYYFDFRGSLDFRFHYTFMPEGIISRLIVRLNHLIYKQAERQLVWRFGVIFAREDCLAEVIQIRYSSEAHRKICVRVTGPDYRKKELLTIISHEIESIHRKSFQHINYEVLIPCNSDICTESGMPEFFTLNRLNKSVDYGDTEIRCMECGKMLNIYERVAGMVPDEARKAPRLPDLYVHKDLSLSSSDISEYANHISERGEDITDSEVTRQLLEILKTQAKHPTSVEVNVNININITNEIKGFRSSLDLMREDLLIDVQDEELRSQMEQELDLIAKASDTVSGLSREDAKDSSFMKRIGGFIKKMEDTNTRVGKVVNAMDNGIGYAQDLAGYYNKIAEWCGMA